MQKNKIDQEIFMYVNWEKYHGMLFPNSRKQYNEATTKYFLAI